MVYIVKKLNKTSKKTAKCRKKKSAILIKLSKMQFSLKKVTKNTDIKK